MYAIVDIETTGSSANGGKITEVAVLIHDGERVVDEYQSLINPERYLPQSITLLTGITQAMVDDAPPFREIANELFGMLEGHVFVAHNVNFDYGFLKKEFQEVGLSFSPTKLCTVRLSRKIFPELKSHALGSLCQYFEIDNFARHRAMGDARATAILLDILLKNEQGEFEFFLKRNSKEAFLPPHLNEEVYEKLPEATGVYYFLDNRGKTLYVGKANQIKKRVRQHFSSTDVIYKQKLKDKIHNIHYELCGDEMIAFLKEAHDIQKQFPPFNKALKFPKPRFGIYAYQDVTGNPRLVIGKIQKGMKPLAQFPSQDKARSFLIQLARENQLDPKQCGLPVSMMSFYGYDTETFEPKAAGERLKNTIEALTTNEVSYVILGSGRTSAEQSVVWVNKGTYMGYGFFSRQNDVQKELLQEMIIRQNESREIHAIIAQYKTKREVIYLS